MEYIQIYSDKKKTLFFYIKHRRMRVASPVQSIFIDRFDLTCHNNEHYLKIKTRQLHFNASPYFDYCMGNFWEISMRERAQTVVVQE